jgi:transcriptional repressor NF-X1
VACEEPITVSCQCDRLKETQKCGAKGANPVVMPLTCNDECLRLIRNKKLADALQIEQFNRPAPDTVHNYEEDLITFSQNNLAFIRKLELDLASYLDRKTSTSLYLPTMKSNQRRAVHMLCQHYKMESTSIDPEPKRSVVVRRTRLSLVPTPLLSQVAGGHFPNPSINQRYVYRH